MSDYVYCAIWYAVFSIIITIIYMSNIPSIYTALSKPSQVKPRQYKKALMYGGKKNSETRFITDICFEMSTYEMIFVIIAFPIAMTCLIIRVIIAIKMDMKEIGSIKKIEVEANCNETVSKGKDNIRLWRHKDKPYTNIIKTAEYSSSVFDWGNSSASAFELAHNILALYVDDKTANELYELFCERFVTSLPYYGGIIKDNDIRKWIEEKTGIKTGDYLEYLKVIIYLDNDGFIKARMDSSYNELLKRLENQHTDINFIAPVLNNLQAMGALDIKKNYFQTNK